MIKFYPENEEFELDLSHVKIKFIEENSIFTENLFKNYTLPFQIPPSTDILEALGNIDVDNITEYKVQFKGKLFVDMDFYESRFILEVERGSIEGTLFYGQETLSILEKPLSEFPFPTVTTSSLILHARDQITKGYPEVGYNFPMVFDDDQKERSGYSYFEGIVNNYNGTNFVTNYADGTTGDAVNRNIMTPFPYILEILRYCFKTVGFDITGDFVNDSRSRFLMLDVKKHLEKLQSSAESNLNFTSPTSQTVINGVNVSEYKITSSVSSNIGTYILECALNLPFNFNILSFEVFLNGNRILYTTNGTISTSLTINQTDGVTGSTIDIVLKAENETSNISNYNDFRLFLKEAQNINGYKDIFSLNEVLPDTTFGDFLLQLKNSLNLKIQIESNYVRFDYVEKYIKTLGFDDHSDFEIEKPKRTFKQNQVFELSQANNDNVVRANYEVLEVSDELIREEDLIPIEIPFERYEVENREGNVAQVRNKDSEFGLLIYKGLDTNGRPTTTDSVDGFSYTLIELYSEFWKDWFHFRTNAEEYRETYIADFLHQLNIRRGIYKYNKKFIPRKVTKTKATKNNYTYEVEMVSF